MKIIVVGATGIIGKAVADALASKHQVLRAARKGTELQVDISKPQSIVAMYEKAGRIDAVVCCAGEARYGALPKTTDDDWSFTLTNKLMGQINLVRLGIDRVSDKGVFVVTAGIYSQKPPPGFPTVSTVNAGLEGFVRGASLDMPRGIRLNAISPPFIKESAQKMGMDAPLTAAENAKAYVACVEGSQTGQVIFT